MDLFETDISYVFNGNKHLYHTFVEDEDVAGYLGEKDPSKDYLKAIVDVCDYSMAKVMVEFLQASYPSDDYSKALSDLDDYGIHSIDDLKNDSGFADYLYDERYDRAWNDFTEGRED